MVEKDGKFVKDGWCSKSHEYSTEIEGGVKPFVDLKEQGKLDLEQLGSSEGTLLLNLEV